MQRTCSRVWHSKDPPCGCVGHSRCSKSQLDACLCETAWLVCSAACTGCGDQQGALPPGSGAGGSAGGACPHPSAIQVAFMCIGLEGQQGLLMLKGENRIKTTLAPCGPVAVCLQLGESRTLPPSSPEGEMTVAACVHLHQTRQHEPAGTGESWTTCNWPPIVN